MKCSNYFKNNIPPSIFSELLTSVNLWFQTRLTSNQVRRIIRFNLNCRSLSNFNSPSCLKFPNMKINDVAWLGNVNGNILNLAGEREREGKDQTYLLLSYVKYAWFLLFKREKVGAKLTKENCALEMEKSFSLRDTLCWQCFPIWKTQSKHKETFHTFVCSSCKLYA